MSAAPRKTFPLRLRADELERITWAAAYFRRRDWGDAWTPTEFIRAVALDVAKLVTADSEGVLPSVRIARLQERIAQLERECDAARESQCDAPAERNAPGSSAGSRCRLCGATEGVPRRDDVCGRCQADMPWADPDDVHPVEG